MRYSFISFIILGTLLTGCSENIGNSQVEESSEMETSQDFLHDPGEQMEAIISEKPEPFLAKEIVIIDSTGNEIWDSCLTYLNQGNYDLDYSNENWIKNIDTPLDWLLLPHDYQLKDYNTLNEQFSSEIYNTIESFNLDLNLNNDRSVVSHFETNDYIDILMNEVYFQPHPQMANQIPQSLSSKYKKNEISKDSTELTCRSDSWYEKFQIIGTGDYNNDNSLDVLIKFSEKAIGGTLAGSSYMLLSKKSETDDVEFSHYRGKQIAEEFQYAFADGIRGEINKSQFNMSLHFKDGYSIEGNYRYYNGSGNLQLNGFYLLNGFIYLNEFDSSGNQTGIFIGEINGDTIDGFWVNPRTKAMIPFTAYAEIVGC